MTKKILMFCIMLGVCISAYAELFVKQPCSDGMVLQQNTEATIWGHASAGARITVCPSWSKTKYKTEADENGVWTVKVSTPAASYTCHSIKISGDRQKLVISDVLIGEVWFAGGQSNMQMPIRGFHNCPCEGYMDIVCQAPARDRIRMYTEPTTQSYEPVSDGKGFWRKADCNSVADMSATAYFFAREMNKMLDVPIGIVANPYGGSRVESWLPKATLEAFGTEDLSPAAIERRTAWERPYLMYNAMLNPLKGYTIKGFIWYQGCSNVGKHDEFVEHMTEMIRQWRSDFSDEAAALPFYMVEIAPYQYSSDPESPYSALLRQAQHEVAATVANCGIIVTNDLVYDYELRNIHPCRKQPVGERLARLALNRDYGMASIFCQYPHALKAYVENGRIFVEFDNCPEGIGRIDGIRTLEVRFGDGQWTEVSSCNFNVGEKRMELITGLPASGGKLQVRYGWGDFRPGNLFNNQGLPFVPFCICEE